MEEQIIIAGFGGQGVLLMGQLLAQAAMDDGKNVSWMPSYGPEMRGGTANCAVVINDEPVGSPVVTEPSTAVIMNRPSLDTFQGIVIPGGALLYNSSLIDVKPNRTDVKIIEVPCNDIALQLGNSRVANMVMLGAYVKLTGIVTFDGVEEALRHKLGPSKEHLMPLNRKALEMGAACVK